MILAELSAVDRPDRAVSAVRDLEVVQNVPYGKIVQAAAVADLVQVGDPGEPPLPCVSTPGGSGSHDA